MNKIGVFIGRMVPIHKGHQRIIQTMIDDCGIDNCQVLIGSSNAPLSWRVLFPYKKRSVWVKRLFPGVRIMGIPDTYVPDDNEWLMYVDDCLASVFPGAGIKDFVFYGGSSEDVVWFYEHGNRHIKIVDREQYPVSATKVRQMLLNGMPIDEVVDKRIAKEVVEAFTSQLDKLDKLGGR